MRFQFNFNVTTLVHFLAFIVTGVFYIADMLLLNFNLKNSHLLIIYAFAFIAICVIFHLEELLTFYIM